MHHQKKLGMMFSVLGLLLNLNRRKKSFIKNDFSTLFRLIYMNKQKNENIENSEGTYSCHPTDFIVKSDLDQEIQ